MKVRLFLTVVCLLMALNARLTGQTAVEYGTGTAAGAGSSTTDAKGLAGSIGGVFNSLDKNLDKRSKGQQGHQAVTAAPAAKPASAARPKTSRTFKPSQIQIGMSREELLSALGKPSTKVSGTDLEGVFSETYTYMYLSGVDTVTVTLHAGKVTRVSPAPEESATAPSPARQPQTDSKEERQQ